MDGQTLVASAERYALTAVLDSRIVSVCAIGSLCLHTSPGDASAILELVRGLTDTAATSGSKIASLFPSSGDSWRRMKASTSCPPATSCCASPSRRVTAPR